jgi:DNA-binding XRE family transcriptional regulator
MATGGRGLRRRAAAIERLHEELLERLSDDQAGDYYEAIAAQVAARRVECGLSQRELARLCDTTQSAIARLERGHRPPRIDTLLRIAAALDCDLSVQLRPRTKMGGT